MVEQKLSGVYCVKTIEVPYSAYENYVDHLLYHLNDDEGLELELVDVIEDSRVVEFFNNALDEYMEEMLEDWNIGESYDDYKKIFKAEIKAHNVEQQRLRKEEEKKAEEERQRLLKEGMQITVSPKDFERAQEILRLAKIIK